MAGTPIATLNDLIAALGLVDVNEILDGIAV